MIRRRDFLQAGTFLALGCATPAREGELIIDAHCHAGKGLHFGKGGEAPWTTYNDPEWTLRKMEEAGIDRTVIFPISNATYEKANEEIASIVGKYPGKFIGFAKHDSKTEEGRIRALLTREVKELGLKGLKLHGTPSREMLETAAVLRIPILCHPAKVVDLRTPATDWPSIPFILAHLGSFSSRDWREHLAAIDLAKSLPNLYLETSSVVFHDYLERAARELPAEKLIFGTDGPLVDSRVELHKIRLLRLSPEKESLVLGANILRVIHQRG